MKIKFFEYDPAHFGRIFNFRVIPVVLLCTASLLFPGSRITGTVTDDAGKPVADVNISIFNTGIGTVSDGAGKFVLSRIPDGRYRIVFEHICCETVFREIESGMTDEISIEITMKNHVIDMTPITALTFAEGYPDVITVAREISLSGAGNAEEALVNVPGVNIENIQGTGTRISVRGTDSKHTTVYLDGVLINSPLDGLSDLSSVPAGMIEKIEIFKSGDAALTGRSTGGVISITTKKGTDTDGVEVYYNNTLYQSDRDEFSTGRLDNHGFGASLKRGFGGGHGVFLSYSGTRYENEWSFINAAKSDEYRYISNPNTPRVQSNTYSDSDDLYASYNYTSGMIDIDAGMNLGIRESGLPGWYDQPYYRAFAKKKNIILSSRILYKPVTDLRTELATSYSCRNDRTNITETDTLFHVDSDDIFENFTTKLSGSYKFDIYEFRAGAEYFTESARSDGLENTVEERRIISGYLKTSVSKQLTGSIKLNTSGTVRKDIISGSDFDKYLISGTASAFYESGDVSLVPSYGYSQSYTLPSFSDLFWAENLFSAGNPELDPEYCVQHEVSITGSYDLDIAKVRLNYTYYDKRLVDLIVWLKRVDGRYTPENFKEGRIKGHEFSAGADLGKYLQIKAGYERMDARQFTDNTVTDNKVIIYKPVEKLSADLTAEYREWRTVFSVEYNGRMYLNETNSINIDPYWLFGAEVSKDIRLLSYDLTVSVLAANLFDEQYQVIYGYPMPGRKIETGIKFKF